MLATHFQAVIEQCFLANGAAFPTQGYTVLHRFIVVHEISPSMRLILGKRLEIPKVPAIVKFDGLLRFAGLYWLLCATSLPLS